MKNKSLHAKVHRKIHDTMKHKSGNILHHTHIVESMILILTTNYLYKHSQNASKQIHIYIYI